MEEEGAEHISTQDVEDAQLRATLAATHVDELRAQVADCSRRQRAKRPRDVVGGAKKGKGKRNRKEKKKPVVAAAVVAAMSVDAEGEEEEEEMGASHSRRVRTSQRTLRRRPSSMLRRGSILSRSHSPTFVWCCGC